MTIESILKVIELAYQDGSLLLRDPELKSRDI
jgi:hypothetical protein